MKRILLPLALIATPLTGCVSGQSVKLNMYQAFGGYDVALKGAVAYANSPSGSPAVVAKLNAVNQSEPVRLAVKYGKAYTLCNASNTAVVAGVDCATFDFRPTTAQGYVKTLRGVILTLTAR